MQQAPSLEESRIQLRQQRIIRAGEQFIHIFEIRRFAVIRIGHIGAFGNACLGQIQRHFGLGIRRFHTHERVIMRVIHGEDDIEILEVTRVHIACH